MKREIKFRVWDFQSENWTGCGFGYGRDGAVKIMCLDIHDKTFVMQFTEMRDRRGKDIYHKDILGTRARPWIVEWQKEEARFVLMPAGRNSQTWKFMDEASGMIVIGNEFENPELTKVVA